VTNDWHMYVMALPKIACALWDSRSQGHACTSVWQSHCMFQLCTQGDTAQHSTAQHSTAQHGTAQHGTAQLGPAQHSMARHGTVMHNIAQHSTAQHSTAQHSTAQHDSTAAQSLELPDTLQKHSLQQKGILPRGRFSTPVTVQTGQLAAVAWGLLVHLALHQGQMAWPLTALPQSKTARCAEALIQGQGARCWAALPLRRAAEDLRLGAQLT